MAVISSNNEVLAREGIDTIRKHCKPRMNSDLRNNEVLAREGIDTPHSGPLPFKQIRG